MEEGVKVKTAKELYDEGMKLKEIHIKPLANSKIMLTKKCEEISAYIWDVQYFCDNASINKSAQEELKASITYIEGNPVNVFESELEKIKKLIK